MNENNEEFLMLAQLIDVMSQNDVVGHEDADIPMGKDLQRLEQFVTGQCSEPVRFEVIEQLRANPHWIPVVVDKVKALR